jgi:hypothetical protein
MTEPTKPASPAVEDAARAAARQEIETSGLTPDQKTVPEKWPFPPSRDYLPEEPHDSVK